MSILVLPSRVHSVTVYRAGALVTRRAALARADGAFPRRVRLTDLPLALDDGSVRARVLTPDGAVAGVAATEVHVGLDEPAIEPVTRPPDEQELDLARLAESRLRAQLAQLAQEGAAIANLAVKPRPAGPDGGPPPPLPTKQRVELMALHAREAARLAERRRELERELRTAAEHRVDLEARKARASTAQPAREDEVRKTVLVALADGGGDADVVLDVQYVVPGARWAPAYALELSADHRQARLSLRAMVCQATGENWPGARLTFSTALPQTWTELPELTSLRIGRRQALGPKRGWVPPPTGAEELYRDFDRHRERAVAPPPPPVASEELDAGIVAGAMMPGAMPITQAGAPAKDRRQKTAKYKSAPPPMAPAPMAPPPLEAMSMSMVPAPARAAGGFIARAASAMFGDEEREVRDRLERLGSSTFAPGGPGGFAEAAAAYEAPEEPRELTVGRDLLDYGRLRMPPPTAGTRGTLRRASEGEVYAELLASLRVHVSVDVEMVLRARMHADAVHGVDLPPRHEPPHAVGGFDYAYPADFPLDVPSDGLWHAVALGARDGVAELTHVCVPRETADVFRQIEVVNPLDAPLLDGPVDIIVAGEFRMTAPLHQVPPRGKLHLGLGTEPAIKVARNTSFREETSGMMGGTLGLEHEIRIEAISHLPGRTQLEVRERLPVAREGDDQAKVVVRDVVPPWLPYDQPDPPLKGGHVWRLALESGKPQTLRAKYAIEIAAKNELVGGNRREA